MDEVSRADRILAELSDDPRVAQVVADAHLFDELRSNPGWQRLFDRVAARKAKWMSSLCTRLMGPQKLWPKPEEIAYYQGFFQGAVWVLAHPEHAERNLERAAERAWMMRLEGE